jgi:hypothetical protein
VRKLAEAAGFGPSHGAEAWEETLGCWGVQLESFFNHCGRLAAGTDLRSAMVGYGEWIKAQMPPWSERRLEQAREALRCLKKGTASFALVEEAGAVVVTYVVKELPVGTGQEVGMVAATVPLASGGPAPKVRRAYLDTGEVDWLRTMDEMMMVRRYALRTRESYLGWARRYLEWSKANSKAAETVWAVQWFLTDLAVGRKISASTQNQALSDLVSGAGGDGGAVGGYRCGAGEAQQAIAGGAKPRGGETLVCCCGHGDDGADAALALWHGAAADGVPALEDQGYRL